MLLVYTGNVNEMFCRKLKDLRMEHELSQAKLAKVLGTHQQTVARWEKGITEPDTKMLAKLCTFFRITANELLGIKD